MTATTASTKATDMTMIKFVFIAKLCVCYITQNEGFKFQGERTQKFSILMCFLEPALLRWIGGMYTAL